MFENSVLIGRLRLRGATGDPLLARLRAEHLLAAAELRPRSLPPGAILCIRSLSDPLPRTLRLDSPAPIADARWRQVLGDRLDELAATAGRPFLGPGGADAVLFRDRAELLAALAIDLSSGQLLNRWWWKHLVRGADMRLAVRDAWLTAPEHIPAALALLAGRAGAVAFLAGLPDADVAAFTRAVVTRFGLVHLHDLTAAPSRDPTAAVGQAAHPAPSAQAPGDAGPERDAGSLVVPPDAPWQPLLPRGAARLDLNRQLLLGLCMILVRQPHIASTERFAREVRAWRAAQPSGPATRRPTGLVRYGPASTRSGPGPTPPGIQADRQPSATNPGWHEVQDASSSLDATARAPINSPPEREFSFPAPKRAPDDSAREGALTLPTRTETAVTPEVVDTAYGGLFYLVNVALALGLYGDFTTPEEPGIELPLWDFLALIGEALVGPDLRKDPVWVLLARLAGRDAAQPGAGFTPPPGSWPEQQEATAVKTGGGLQVWVRRWTAHIRDRLYAALGYAAGGQRPGVTRDEVARHVLAYRGRAVVSVARLDITYRLDDLDVAVRLAGLDRNPGWVPAAGRTIEFHYE